MKTAVLLKLLTQSARTRAPMQALRGVLGIKTPTKQNIKKYHAEFYHEYSTCSKLATFASIFTFYLTEIEQHLQP